jgi:hypothetical protein
LSLPTLILAEVLQSLWASGLPGFLFRVALLEPGAALGMWRPFQARKNFLPH